MTREAKIGLLTGLGVIVLIGILLSNYLGGPAAGAGAGGAPGASVRMAALPMGASYRERMMQPAGVPAMAPSGGASTADAGNTAVAAGPVGDDAPPRGYAVDANDGSGSAAADSAGPRPGQPIVAGPVTPIPAGRALGIPSPVDGARVPVIQLVDDRTPVAGRAPGGAAAGGGVAAAAGLPRATGREYTIASGDTLGKIAAKFYKSNKPENVQRIVAANPTVLKSASSMLFVGKKLLIPDLPAPAAPKAAPHSDVGPPAAPRVVVYAPGARTAAVRASKDASGRLTAPKADEKKDAVVWYVVKHGDTLGAIAARHVANGNRAEIEAMISKIAALNKIKDTGSLQLGMKLKLPGK